VTIFVKVIPNLENGIIFVAFINDYQMKNERIKSEYFIMIGIETKLLLGISESCFENFKISLSLMDKRSSNCAEFLIDKLIPGLTNKFG